MMNRTPASAPAVRQNRPVPSRDTVASTVRPPRTTTYGHEVITRMEPPLLRAEIGDVLRSLRQDQGRTLREVSSDAQVSLGYLSEVERGQKEASSELLEAITGALGVPLWLVLREVSDRMADAPVDPVPDTVPDDLMPVALIG